MRANSLSATASMMACTLLLSACASIEPPSASYYQIDPGTLPTPDVTLNIPGLGPCTDNPDRSLHLNSAQTVSVLVHGCFGSSGQFRGLAQVLAFQGQQSACFTYDDRAALTDSASQLRYALNELAEQSHVPQINLIGHSQGALVARKSLTTRISGAVPASRLHLVTISGPFGGIAAAKPCGNPWLKPLTLGLITASCRIATGAKWADITEYSDFIRTPGELSPQVQNYLKIDTDEKDSCRQEKNGRCVESDDIFSLTEQHNNVIETGPLTHRLEVKAGHVEIVGDKKTAPVKLLAVLQAQGILHPIDASRVSAFRTLLTQVYQDAAPRWPLWEVTAQ
ncbi:alpha/beta hydrolase [Uliginosibacterium gangwonense]|uniref:alpha/beta hydrolase n=1 Tax=Uliginosibacterium gangwonense TaxID=392736 RepID=UPI00037530A6|nr:alpha/beta hydrolase [Uliginosibacterium gangwonense]